MNNNIHIENPCHVSWEGMTKTGEGRHCGVCRAQVVDFTNKTGDEISRYFKKPGKDATCGLYQQRHTSRATRWEQALNRLESAAGGFKIKRALLFALGCLLLISSCSRRVVKGKRMPYGDKNPWPKSQPAKKSEEPKR